MTAAALKLAIEAGMDVVAKTLNSTELVSRYASDDPSPVAATFGELRNGLQEPTGVVCNGLQDSMQRVA